jgi:hypothetical protein
MLPEGTDSRFGFSCECGCGELVPLTAATFDANGGWVDGHKPKSPPDPHFDQSAANGNDSTARERLVRGPKGES